MPAILACAASPWCSGPILGAAAILMSPPAQELFNPPNNPGFCEAKNFPPPAIWNESSTGAGKNDQHGDGGRSTQKTQKQIEDLQKQLETATGNNKKKISQKIKNIKESNQRKKKGENHSQRGKGQ